MRINIYSPTYHRFEKTKVAVESIIKTVNESVHDVKYYLCDNNSPQEMKDWLCKQVDENERLEGFFCEENWGKAKIVNHVHSTARECEFVVSIDSDMRNVHSEYNWIDEMVSILGNVPQIGVLSTFQEGANCHHLHTVPQRIKVQFPDGKEHLVRHGAFGGIAGGCIMLRTVEFNNIGMYQVYDVYNGDDAMIMRKTHEKMKKICAVSETVALEHMQNYEDEKEYQAWKIKKCQGHITSAPGTKGFFDD
jgi:hypothetical protein